MTDDLVLGGDFPTWERIRWPEDAPLPAAGSEVPFDVSARGLGVQRRPVLAARPDFEPG